MDDARFSDGDVLQIYLYTNDLPKKTLRILRHHHQTQTHSMENFRFNRQKLRENTKNELSRRRLRGVP